MAATIVTIGYARVSTDGQTLDTQHAALKRAGAKQIFSEKESGAKTDRAQLAKALAALSPGDVLLVTRLDRLARSTRDLLNVLDASSLDGHGSSPCTSGARRSNAWMLARRKPRSGGPSTSTPPR